MKGIFVIGLMALLLLVGCVNSTSNSSISESTDTMDDHMDDMNDDYMTDDSMHDDNMMMDDHGEMMEGNVEYVPFTQSAYDAAKNENKVIFLEFYANWCPICKEQAPSLTEGLESIHSDKLVAFRVNYNDSETDASEIALAQQLNVTYQHTHILLGSDGKELLRSNEQWSVTDVKEKIGVLIQ